MAALYYIERDIYETDKEYNAQGLMEALRNLGAPKVSQTALYGFHNFPRVVMVLSSVPRNKLQPHFERTIRDVEWYVLNPSIYFAAPVRYKSPNNPAEGFKQVTLPLTKEKAEQIVMWSSYQVMRPDENDVRKPTCIADFFGDDAYEDAVLFSITKSKGINRDEDY